MALIDIACAGQFRTSWANIDATRRAKPSRAVQSVAERNGFDYFYGFVGGDASQWQPNLFRNTSAIYPFQGNPGWNLETAMADEAIQYMKQLKEIAPDKPLFVYYVPG
jgi:arylsulfatase A-like enzyme